MSCALCEEDVELCYNEAWAGAAFAACHHAACSDCQGQWVAAYDAAHGRRQRAADACDDVVACPERVPCFADGCQRFLPSRLVIRARRRAELPVPPARVRDRARSRARACAEEEARSGSAGGDWEAALELAWLRSAAAAWGLQVVSRTGPRTLVREQVLCTACGEGQPALLVNGPCGHEACARCWARRVEEHLAQGAGGLDDATCCRAGCGAHVSWGLLRGVCIEYSTMMSRCVAEVDAAFRLKDQRNRCQACGKKSYTFLPKNAKCGHEACHDCWLRWAEPKLPVCLEACSFVPCLRPDCEEAIRGPLWACLSQSSDCIQAFEKRVQSEARCLRDAERSGVRVVWNAGGLACGHCRRQAWGLVRNGCGHAACPDCWLRWAESRGSAGIETCSLIPCIHPDCGEAILGPLWAFLCRSSMDIQAFENRVRADSEARWLRDAEKRGARVDWAPSPAGSGPACGHCGRRAWGLLVNDGCDHRACRDCWAKAGVGQAHEMRARPRCLECEQAAGGKLWDLLERFYEPLRAAARERRAEVVELNALSRAGVHLAWEPSTAQAGPVCTICAERSLALLCNSPCGHQACQSCWARWGESQLERYSGSRQQPIEHARSWRLLRCGCFAPGCEQLVALPFQRHLEQRSQALAGTMGRRRRLQENALYPAAVQVDCPGPGCWGLGYLGFDLVMCFVCERQWAPDEAGAPAPVDVDVEEVMGVKVKRCPSCSEYIEKNGGCDHMTCKCGHEFRWSTLTPYRP